MSITLSSLLLCVLLLPADGQSGAPQGQRSCTYSESVLAAVEEVNSGVKVQLEKLIVDLAELVNVTVGQNASCQCLDELHTLTGRQAVSAAVQV